MGDGMYYRGMGKFGRNWWRLKIHSPHLSHHPSAVFVYACKIQNEITLCGIRLSVQVFIDAPLAHVCVYVCCELHESIVGSDLCKGSNGI